MSASSDTGASSTPSSALLKGIRVCMATSGHPADDDRIFFKEARSLVKAGADVVVLCARDKMFPEKPDGVRFANYPGGGSLKDRAFTLGELEEAIAEQECDVVHCHEPDSLISALRVKRRLGTKVIFDSHEMWSGVAAARFPRLLWPAVTAGYRYFERRWLSQCDAAVGASHAITDLLATSLSSDRVVTILNVPVVDIFGDGAERDWGAETILCHDGSLTFVRGLKTMAEAVRLLAKQHRVVFKIVGDVFGPEKVWLEQFIAKHQLESVIVRTGWLPYKEVGKAIAPCHIGLVGFLPSPNHLIAAPNKCFNYLMYGLPVVGPDFPMSHFAILAREGCARLVDPTSADSIAETIGRMIIDRKSTRSIAATAFMLSRTKYRWQHMETILLDLYLRVLAQDKL